MDRGTLKANAIVAFAIGTLMLGFVGISLGASGVGAQLLEFDTSARSEGMGGATTAMSWNDSPNVWANPALLGYHRGLHYQRFHRTLYAGGMEDHIIESNRVTLGAFGVGLLIAGAPLGRNGGDHLNMGRHATTDEDGNPRGSFDSYMKVESWGVGVSLGQVYDGIRGAGANRKHAFTRHGDIAVGWVGKRYRDKIAPDGPDGSDSAHATMYDIGLALRLTPYNSIGTKGDASPVINAAVPRFGGVRIDLGCGWSDLNCNDARIVHVDVDQSDPAPRMRRNGYAARVAVGMPRFVDEAMSGGRLRFLTNSVRPLISYTVSWDQCTPWQRWDVGREDYVPGENRVEQMRLRGSELVLANVLYLRNGHIEDRARGIVGSTSGWGIGFKYLDLVGFQYDCAKTPSPQGLPPVASAEYSVSIDGVGLWSRLR